eukprot:2590008-Prymnesium_polylepis.1
MYQQRMRDLGEQPRSLRDFADYCENLNQVKAEHKEMEERAMRVNDMCAGRTHSPHPLTAPTHRTHSPPP